MLRVRFAPSPTGFLHIGSARTFIFNWLYARRNGGTMILRIDDTDVERNTQASLDSIFDGLRWLDLGWDEAYRQSERLALHRQMAEAIFAEGLAYRDFTPAERGGQREIGRAGDRGCSTPACASCPREESDRRAAAGEPFVLRFRVPRETRAARSLRRRGLRRAIEIHGRYRGFRAAAQRRHADLSHGLLRRRRRSAHQPHHPRPGPPHQHLQARADLRGRWASTPPQFAHLPLLIAPDGAKLSKRKHGPVVSVTTYRDAGFLPQAFVNFLCLLGWSPKDDREQMTRQELIDAFSLEGINRSNAVVNFTEEDPFDPKAVWLNAEHIRAMPVDELAERLLPFVRAAGFDVDPARCGRSRR